jgi:hypothetical protein
VEVTVGKPPVSGEATEAGQVALGGGPVQHSFPEIQERSDPKKSLRQDKGPLDHSPEPGEKVCCSSRGVRSWHT